MITGFLGGFTFDHESERKIFISITFLVKDWYLTLQTFKKIEGLIQIDINVSVFIVQWIYIFKERTSHKNIALLTLNRKQFVLKICSLIIKSHCNWLLKTFIFIRFIFVKFSPFTYNSVAWRMHVRLFIEESLVRVLVVHILLSRASYVPNHERDQSQLKTMIQS